MPGLEINSEIVGKNIRRIRKSKGITIIQLAKALGYSIGKLSNIENGKREKFPYDELVEIAGALDVPVEELLYYGDRLDFSLEPELEKIKHSINIAKHKLSAGLLHGLSETLEVLRKSAEQFPNKNILGHLYFVWAEYYRELSEYEMAKEYYRETIKTIKSDGSDRDSVEVKMRSYNGLASLYFEERNFFEAINVLREALNFSEGNPHVYSLDLSNVHYNLTIIYLHIGYIGLAEYHIKSCMEITRNKNEQAYYHAAFLLSITYWIQGKNNKARAVLIESMNWFQRQKDLGSLYKALELIFFIQRVRPNMLFTDFFSDLREFLDVQVPPNVVPQQVRCCYCLIELEIQRGNYSEAGRMIEKCKQRIEEYHIEDGFRLYALEADLIKKATGDTNAEQMAIEKALSYFSSEDRSVEKARLLYRLGKLSSFRANTLFEEALRIYEKNHAERNFPESFWLSILPKLRY